MHVCVGGQRERGGKRRKGAVSDTKLGCTKGRIDGDWWRKFSRGPSATGTCKPCAPVILPVPKHRSIPKGKVVFPQQSPWMTISIQTLRGQVLLEWHPVGSCWSHGEGLQGFSTWQKLCWATLLMVWLNHQTGKKSHSYPVLKMEW